MARTKKTLSDLKGLPLKAIVNQLSSKYGANTLALATEAEGLTIKFISTGAYALDFGLGGGVPENRITELRGAPSALKSTVCNNTIANFQRKYPEGKVFYEDGERSFDPKYAKLCGVDLENLAIINSDSGEQAIDVISDLMDIGCPLFVVVDSIASLVPAAEIESSMDQQSMGLQARLINRMMRILTAGTKRAMYDSSAATTTILATNQLREKIGVMFGNPETTPGGKGKDFYYSVKVKFMSPPSARIMEKISRNGVERERRMGQKVSFTVDKNKVSSSQFEQGEFNYYVREYKGHKPFSFDNEEALFKFGVYFGVISSGTQYRYGKLAAKRDREFKKALLENPRVAREIYEEVIQEIVAEDLPDARVVKTGKGKRMLKFKTARE